MALSARPPRYKYAAVALSPSCLTKLPVPAEFAARLQPYTGDEEREVILVGPLGKVCRAELRWQDGACWLVGGWAELAAAHGIGEGWSVVLRRERRGVATLSAFDTERCLARICTPLAGVTSKIRPRFLKLLQPDDLEKMRIPDKFVQQHLTSCLSSQNALILCPLGKFWQVKLDHGQPDVLHGDDWARFLAAHDLAEGSILLFRYEGNMVLSVEVFLPNGCLKEYHTAISVFTTDGTMGPSPGLPQSGQPKSKPAAISQRQSFTKKINSCSLNKYLTVKRTFCSSIGLLGPCTIKLKTSMESTRSWPVDFNFTTTNGQIRGKGWKKFCEDNDLEEGDCCTFKVIERKVWLVAIK